MGEDNAHHRLRSLDAARGVAAMLVVLDHFIIVVMSPPLDSPLHYMAAFAGSFGIGLFFLLSGFVIPMSLSAGTSIFLVRRALRIYPVAIIGTVLAVGVFFLIDKPQDTFWQTLSLFGIFFSPNETMVQSVYWTLTIEVCFYLFAALVGKFLSFPENAKSALSKTAYPWLLAAGVLSAWYMRAEAPFATSPAAIATMVVLSCWPMLFLGWCTNLRVFAGLTGTQWAIAIAVSLFVLLQSPYPVYFSMDLGAPSWGCAFGVFCYLVLSTHGTTAQLVFARLQPLGRISFPVYVVHVPATHLLHLWIGPSVVKLALYLSVVLLLSIMLHLSIEQPFVNLGRRFSAMRSPTRASGALSQGIETAAQS